MFTSINNILGVKPRHAEENDTRQDIQRHDPDHENRRRKKKDAEEELFGQDDGANISIDALQTFLNKFLKELSEKQPKKRFNATSKPTSEAEETITPPQEKEPKPKSVQAARAASAYQHAADGQHENSLFSDMNENNANPISLDAAEIRTIHELLSDLELLSKKNIEYIHIERAENFLQSLVNAVNTLKKSKLFNA